MENNDLNLEFPDVNAYGETTSIKEPTEKEISHAFYSTNRDSTFYSVGDLKCAGYTKLIRSKPKEDLEPGVINDNVHPYSQEGVVRLFRQKAIYQNVNTGELGLLIRYFYEYYDEYSHKYKYKLISKEMYDEARRQYAKRQSEKEKAAADKLIADFKPENFWTKKQKDSFIKQLEEYCANDYIDYNLVTQIEKEIDAELNSPGWCVVCKLTDNYAKSHPDSRSKIEKKNLTKEEANNIADYYNEPVYRQLNVSNAWSYSPMKMSDAEQFLVKRNAEEDNFSNSALTEMRDIESADVLNKINESVVYNHDFGLEFYRDEDDWYHLNLTKNGIPINQNELTYDDFIANDDKYAVPELDRIFNKFNHILSSYGLVIGEDEECQCIRDIVDAVIYDRIPADETDCSDLITGFELYTL